MQHSTLLLVIIILKSESSFWFLVTGDREEKKFHLLSKSLESSLGLRYLEELRESLVDEDKGDEESKYLLGKG